MGINRRHFLKSAGVCLALPALESLGASTDGKIHNRMVFICNKLGFYPESFFPVERGPLAASSDYMKILSRHFKRMTVLSGLSHANQAGRLSHSSETTWLTAAQHPGLDGFKNTISVDQFAASQLGYVTRHPSLCLSTNGAESQSYSENGIMVPAESSPAALFSNLFLNGSKQEIAEQQQKLNMEMSILDGLIEQSKTLMKSASKADREKITQYLESVRQTEKDLAQAGVWLKKPKPEVNAAKPRDIAQKNDMIGKLDLLLNLIPLILQTDSTRVLTLTIQLNHGKIKLPGVLEDHHNISHHGKSPEKIKQLKIIESAIMKSMAGFIDKMVASDQLDTTSVLLGSNLSNASIHDTKNLPLLLFGGGFKHGSHVVFDQKNNKPLSNLFLSMLHKSGIKAESFAYSNGTLTW